MLSVWKDGPLITDSLTQHIARQRSIENLPRFLGPTWPTDLHDPLLLPDGERAIDRIQRAITTSEKVGIVGDYDMDGTPGAALLVQFFSLFSMEPSVILPTRSDGYGFSPNFVDRFANTGITLIITVDCGIRDFAAIERANEKSIDVIVIDHHECPENLPPAYAIVNPKRSDNRYPFDQLCGTGVTFKVLQAYFEKYQSSLPTTVTKNWLAWSLDLVGLATLGDMVPLVDENRLFARYGLRVLQRGSRPGLRRLIEACELNLSELTYSDVAFKIISKCNASGRMDAMDDVLLLLTDQSQTTYDHAVKNVLTRDTRRQMISKQMYEQAQTMVDPQNLPSVIVLAHETWHPGVTGILASRLSEEYQRPSVVLGTLDGKEYRGSFRSYNGVAGPQLLKGVENLLERYGGHNEAAGLAIANQRLPEFKEILEKSQLSPLREDQKLSDGTLLINQTDLVALADLERFTPWGIGNEEPLWNLNNVILGDMRWIGERQNHLKAALSGTSHRLDIIGFGCESYKGFDFSRPTDILGTLSINRFRGKSSPQFQLKGIREVGQHG